MNRLLALTVSSFILTACGVTTPVGVTNQGRLTDVQTELMTARNSAPRAAYTNYLRAIDAASPELVSLTELPGDLVSGPDNDNKLLAMTVAIQAAGYLADIPNLSEAEASALDTAAVFVEETSRMCETTPEKRECIVAAAEGSTLLSRLLATDILSIAFNDEAPEISSVTAGFLAFSDVLPDEETLTSGAPTTDLIRTALTEQGCTLSRAEPFLRMSVGNENVPALRAQFQSTVADLFDRTTLSLCADGSEGCSAAVTCSSDSTSEDCQGAKTSAFINYCSPDTSGLGEYLETSRMSAGG